MLQRCYNQKLKNYKYYGGRGIAVCHRWCESFDLFLKDVGKRPSPSHSLHRKDNDKGYEAGNVVWATDTEQNRATSRNRFVARKLLVEAAEQLGTSTTTIARRIDVLRWSEKEAVTKKPRVWKHRDLTFEGETLSLNAWSRRLRISSNTLRGRLLAGWSVEQTLAIKPSLGNRVRLSGPLRRQRF